MIPIPSPPSISPQCATQASPRHPAAHPDSRPRDDRHPLIPSGSMLHAQRYTCIPPHPNPHFPSSKPPSFQTSRLPDFQLLNPIPHPPPRAPTSSSPRPRAAREPSPAESLASPAGCSHHHASTHPPSDVTMAAPLAAPLAPVFYAAHEQHSSFFPSFRGGLGRQLLPFPARSRLRMDLRVRRFCRRRRCRRFGPRPTLAVYAGGGRLRSERADVAV